MSQDKTLLEQCPAEGHSRRQFLRAVAGTTVGATAALSLARPPMEAHAAQVPTNGQPLSVKDYGAKGDGKADDTAAIQKAITEAPQKGCVVSFPTGFYLVSQPIVVKDSVSLVGEGEQLSQIVTNQAAGDVIVVQAGGVHLRLLAFQSNVKRTGGAYVNFTADANQSSIDHFYMGGAFVGINMSSNATLWVERGSIRDSATGPGSSGIVVNGGNDHFIRYITMDNPPSARPSTGLSIQNTGCVTIDALNIVNCINALSITQGASIYIMNSFFDTSVVGIMIDPKPFVVRTHFIGCWTSSHDKCGVIVTGIGVDTLEFIGHHCVLNAGDGFQIAAARNLKLSSCTAAQNGGDGVVLGPGVSHSFITSSTLGATSTLKGNTYGLRISPGADHLVIAHNDLTGNTTAALEGTAAQSILSPNLT